MCSSGGLGRCSRRNKAWSERRLAGPGKIAGDSAPIFTGGRGASAAIYYDLASPFQLPVYLLLFTCPRRSPPVHIQSYIAQAVLAYPSLPSFARNVYPNPVTVRPLIGPTS